MFVAGAVALIGFSRLVAGTTSSMSSVERGFSRALRIFLGVWVISAIAYSLLVGLDFTSFIPTYLGDTVVSWPTGRDFVAHHHVASRLVAVAC